MTILGIQNNIILNCGMCVFIEVKPLSIKKESRRVIVVLIIVVACRHYKALPAQGSVIPVHIS